MRTKTFLETFDHVYVDIDMLEVVGLISFGNPTEQHHVSAYTWSGRQVMVAQGFSDKNRALQVQKWIVRMITTQGRNPETGKPEWVTEDGIIPLPTKWTDAGEPVRPKNG